MFLARFFTISMMTFATARVLTAMVDDRQIPRERALEIARLVLHDDAARLYGLAR